MITYRLKPLWEVPLTRNPEKRSSSSHADINISLKQVWKSLCQFIHSDKEHRLKLQALDVAHVKHTNLLRISNVSSVSTADNLQVSVGQERRSRLHDRVDTILRVNEHGD